jgi:serine-type D-Ala-D-Ala carboxypeptidase/endopeptidase (penicillin-binding protein 4)
VAGNLVLAGGGDPNLSGRVLPYRTGSAGVTGNPLAALEDLANQVAGRGVTRIDGDLVGDDTWYVWEPYVAGWALEDTVSDDGAPVSALAVNDNLVTLTVRPAGRAGEMALLSWRPLGETYAVENRVRTVASGERSLRLERLPGSRGAVLSGSVPLRDRGADFVLGVDDPALHAATLFRRLLEERGITITGQTLARHRDPAEVADLVHGPAEPAAAGNVELAARTSAPLLEELRVMDKVSQNLHAEMALRAVAKARRGVGSREAGVDEMKTFLGEVGIEPSAAHLVDGSGLARLNLVSPSAVVKLLRYVYATPERDRWIALLPVGGTDGTLSTRFGDSAAAGKVHAKTGSLNSVSALSGYIERPSGMVAFSILVNNYNGAAAEVRAVIDRICTLLSE